MKNCKVKVRGKTKKKKHQNNERENNGKKPRDLENA